MALLSVGDYRPDVSDYQTQTTRNILNVVPRGDGYGPVKSLSAISSALGGQCRGAFLAYKADGSVVVFAATSTDLYTLDNTTYAWTNVSKGGSSYSAVPSTDIWRFAQFNTLVIAVQANTVPQVFTLGVSSAFADLAGSPPQCRYIDIVGRFAVLSGLLSYPQRIQWSGLNDVNGSSSWTPGVNSSDYQDLPDGGFCRGVAGGETGVILQDNAIRRMTYVPGSPVVFQIERIVQDLGIYGAYSIVRAGASVFFYTMQGFYRVDPGALPAQIGKERVDRTFALDLETSSLQLFSGAFDPRAKQVIWVYRSVNGSANKFDSALCYDIALDKFTHIDVEGEVIFSNAQPGITLESIDTLFSSLDDVPGSLDAFAISGIPELAVFDTSHKLSFFRGSNLEATLETSEQGTTDGTRVFISGFRPVTDAATVYGSVSSRETLCATESSGTEVSVNATTGRCDVLLDTRFSRMKCRIPAGTSWTFFNGVEPEMDQAGKL